MSKVVNLFSTLRTVFDVFNISGSVKRKITIMKKKFLVAIIAAVTAAFFLMILWTLLLMILYVYLLKFAFSPIQAMSILFGINCLILVIVSIFIFKLRNQLHFPETWRQTQNLTRSVKKL